MNDPIKVLTDHHEIAGIVRAAATSIATQSEPLSHGEDLARLLDFIADEMYDENCVEVQNQVDGRTYVTTDNGHGTRRSNLWNTGLSIARSVACAEVSA